MNKALKNLFLFILVVTLLVTGCNSKKTEKIAILKYVTHPALNELELGVLEVLNPYINEDTMSGKIQIELYNANGNAQRAKELAASITRSDVSLIVGIATPSAIAVIKTPSNIPLLYGAVADPEGAGIIPSARSTGIKNVGPKIIERAIYFIKVFFPKAKKIGTIYNPSEQNSVYVQNLIKKVCTDSELELIQTTVNDPSQLGSATEDLISRVDVIYSANDNTVNAGINSIISRCKTTKTPFILGDLSTLSKGAFAAVGLEYKSMGKDLGKMAIEILKGKNVSDLPPRDTPIPKIWVNKSVMEYLGYSIPDNLKSIIDKMI